VILRQRLPAADTTALVDAAHGLALRTRGTGAGALTGIQQKHHAALEDVWSCSARCWQLRMRRQWCDAPTLPMRNTCVGR